MGGMGGAGPEPTARCVPGPAADWHSTVLTREQYVNAASDLVGFDVRPLVRFSDAGARKFLAGVSVSALELEQRAATAEGIAAAATTPARLAALASCDPAKLSICADQLIPRLGLRAFRRPLSSPSALALRKLFDAGSAEGGLAGGVEWLLLGILQAPDFVYQLAPRMAGAPGAAVALDDYTLASRLAFFLWNSGPDDDLLAAAGKGGLGARGMMDVQVRRMLADPRSARTREDYYGGWLKLDTLASATRSVPEFNPGLAALLTRSVLDGIHAVYREGAQVETLLGTSTLFADAALAKLYGLPPPAAGPGLQPVAASPEQRRGLITHPALLANLATAEGSDPIKRGVFVTEALLCVTLPDPAPNIPDLPPPRAGLTMRQRLEQHRSAPACASCHQLFDPVGLALENYDSIGRYRQTDEGAPVDSSAEVQQGLDLDGKYQNGLAWLARLPASASVRDCMVQHWMEYALRRDLGPGDACATGAIQRQFRERGDLSALLANIATSESFLTALADTGATP
jgi:hypothetical protein